MALQLPLKFFYNLNVPTNEDIQQLIQRAKYENCYIKLFYPYKDKEYSVVIGGSDVVGNVLSRMIHKKG